jgi:hypothetical protein
MTIVVVCLWTKNCVVDEWGRGEAKGWREMEEGNLLGHLYD